MEYLKKIIDEKTYKQLEKEVSLGKKLVSFLSIGYKQGDTLEVKVLDLNNYNDYEDIIELHKNSIPRITILLISSNMSVETLFYVPIIKE